MPLDTIPNRGAKVLKQDMRDSAQSNTSHRVQQELSVRTYKGDNSS